MKQADFAANFPGRLVPCPDGGWAFVPSPLPPRLTFGTKELGLLSNADQALGQLAGVGWMLPNPHLLIGPFLRREAVLSNRIEGTITKVEELLLFEATPNDRKDGAELLEVANYVQATEFGLERLKSFPLCLRFIREVH